MVSALWFIFAVAKHKPFDCCNIIQMYLVGKLGSGVVRMVDACQMQGVPVIVDRDLATLYGVETKRMNEQVRRNLNRFPPRFRFQLTKEEVNEVVANCDHLLSIKYSPTPSTDSPFGRYPTIK